MPQLGVVKIYVEQNKGLTLTDLSASKEIKKENCLINPLCCVILFNRRSKYSATNATGYSAAHSQFLFVISVFLIFLLQTIKLYSVSVNFYLYICSE